MRTIQDAVDAADNDGQDIIQLQDGTWSENVTIAKDLTILGHSIFELVICFNSAGCHHALLPPQVMISQSLPLGKIDQLLWCRLCFVLR